MNMIKFLLKLLCDETGSLSLSGDVGGDGGSDGGSPDPVSDEAGDESGAGDADPNPTLGDPEPAPSILNDLEEDIRNDPTLKVFIDEKGEFNVKNALKSYVHAQRKMGEKGVRVPDKNSSDEEWQQFYSNLRPDELEKYELNANLGEDQKMDEEMFGEFKKLAHESGLAPKQAEKLLGWYNERVSKSSETQVQEAQSQYNKEVNELKTEWGDAVDREMGLAKRALKEFADDKTVDYLKQTGLDKNVQLIRLFNKIGKGLMEDSFDKESHGSFGITKEEAERKMASIYGDPNHAYFNPQHPSNKHAIDEMTKLMEAANR